MTTATLRHAGWILRGNPLTAVAAAGVFLLALIAIFGPWIVPYDPIVSNVSQALMPPSAAHIAGTDQLGRDVFSRLIVAASDWCSRIISCSHILRSRRTWATG